jgi:nucleotide-binding universal stress UspA family protein
VTPPENPGRIRVEDASRLVRRIIAPVDLTPASTYQAEVAAQLAEAIALPLVFVHVLEPVSPSWATRPGPNVLVEDRQTSIAQTRITTLLTTMPRELDVASLMLRGDPAEEVARVVRDSHAGLVVMGLHDRTACGPRLGSVAFRTLSLAPVLVLGLPPRLSSAVRADDSPARLHVTELLEAASR